MGAVSARDLRLSALEQGLPGLSRTWGAFLAQAGTICLECQNHKTGVELKVFGTKPAVFNLCWGDQKTEQVLNSWDDLQEATEYGACGVAILLVLKLTPFTVIRRARKGTGIDYWLGRKNADKPFQDAARLEISGILQGSDGQVKSRISTKKKQTEASDYGLPAYVVVVEFSQPVSHLVKK
jgi:hypothetical protein